MFKTFFSEMKKLHSYLLSIYVWFTSYKLKKNDLLKSFSVMYFMLKNTNTCTHKHAYILFIYIYIYILDLFHKNKRRYIKLYNMYVYKDSS